MRKMPLFGLKDSLFEALLPKVVSLHYNTLLQIIRSHRVPMLTFGKKQKKNRGK